MAAVSYDAITRNRSGDMRSAEVPFRHFCNFVKKKLIQSALDELAQGNAECVPGNGSASDTRSTSGDWTCPVRGVRVLDLASGRGGDLFKWLFMQSSPNATGRKQGSNSSTSSLCSDTTAHPICPVRASEYDCFDISPESINEAKHRYISSVQSPPPVSVSSSSSSTSWTAHRRQQNQRQHRGGGATTNFLPAPPSPPILCKARFSVDNCFDVAFLQRMLDDESSRGRYHVVTIQFAFHYACRKESNIALLLRAIAHVLAPGGIFIATTVDPFRLSERVRSNRWGNELFRVDLVHSPPQWQPACSVRNCKGDSSSNNSSNVRKSTCEDNKITISAKNDANRQEASAADMTEQDSSPMLLTTGTAYHFTLNGFVDCDEYVVPLPFVRQYAAEAGLCENTALSRPFEDFITEYTSEWRMNKGNTLSSEERELVTLYCSMYFVKQESEC